MSHYTIILLISIFLILPQSVFADTQSDDKKSWYLGEGLKKRDHFSYSLCHIDYKDCSPLRIDFLIENETKIDDRDFWKVKTVVRDGTKVHLGFIIFDKFALTPYESSDNLESYTDIFESSIALLASYAQPSTLPGRINIGPENFDSKSWSNVYGENRLDVSGPEQVSTPEGTFDAYVLSSKSKAKTSKIWIVDGFPFPVKADTYAHVADGVPPQEYRFELLDYQKVKPGRIGEPPIKPHCKFTGEYDRITKKSYLVENTNSMLIEVQHSKNPKYDCPMDIIINFKQLKNPEEFVNQVHYDILVVRMTVDGAEPIRSIANEEARKALFTTNGQVRTTIDIKESGKTTYAIIVAGIGQQTPEPNPANGGFVLFDVYVEPRVFPTIPRWVKDYAKSWSQGTIGHNEYVTTIQYMINQKIIDIPFDELPDEKANTVPPWVKNTAKLWSEGKITDKDYVLGLQYLIKQKIIKLKLYYDEIHN